MTIKTLFFTGLILGGAISSIAQTRDLTRGDKIRLIQTILRSEDLGNTATCCEKRRVNIVYILKTNLTKQELPRRRGIKFELISPEKVDEMAKTSAGVEYYKIEGPGVDGGRAIVTIRRTFLSESSGSGSVVDYSAWKVADKWNYKVIGASAYTAEKRTP